MLPALSTRKGESVSNQDIVPGFDDESCYDLTILLHCVEGRKAALALELIGNVELYNSECLREKGMKAIEAGFNQLVFLLRGVDYISSTGVAAFVFFAQGGKATGRGADAGRSAAAGRKCFQVAVF
jgi:hypothetical protein